MSPRAALSLAELERLLDEDAPYGDLTTRALGIGACAGRMRLSARYDMCVCGTEDAERLLQQLGLSVQRPVASGRKVAAGTLLLQASGPAAELFVAWKVVQTLIEWLSGIASATDELVRAARAVAPDIVVACTRKNLPSTRRLAANAVTAGGGSLHRLGLSESVLLFPEHRHFLPQPLDIAAAITQLRRVSPERAIVVEVTSEAEALQALAARPDVLQLEKFSPEAVGRMRDARGARQGMPRLAAAGGVNVANAAAYAAAGAEVLVTSAPYAAAPKDVAVELRPVDAG